ncbi:hypothetical protein [Glutamicibacter ardleyensis]|uniref:hypothetical protein n=1 Tax=Glutamicibacter ardleyensis TaxID=225894 RepID=UPI003FD35FD7
MHADKSCNDAHGKPCKGLFSRISLAETLRAILNHVFERSESSWLLFLANAGSYRVAASFGCLLKGSVDRDVVKRETDPVMVTTALSNPFRVSRDEVEELFHLRRRWFAY